MDAVKLLSRDHRTVEKLFQQFRSGSEKTKQRCIEQLVEELTVHAMVEEKFLYPKARRVAPDLVKEALSEHAGVKKILKELRASGAAPEDLATKVNELEEDVSHHVEEEESELFPKLESEIGKDELDEIGAKIGQAKSGGTGRRSPGTTTRRRGRSAASERSKRPKQKVASRQRRTKTATSRKRTSKSRSRRAS